MPRSTLVGVLMLSLMAATAHAQLSAVELACLEGIAKASGTFVKKKLSAVQKCKNRALDDVASNDCAPGELQATIAATLETMLGALDAKCGTVSEFNLAGMGFPGKCVDPTPSTRFNLDDLKACIASSHQAGVDELVDIEYGTTTGPLDSFDLKCQATIGKESAKFVNAKLKAIQKCRNALNKGTLSGFAGRSCATSDAKAQAAIAKAESKARAKILGSCTDANMVALDVGDPSCSAWSSTAAGAAACLLATHHEIVDNPDDFAPADLIDFEYGAPASCGDGVKNTPEEECDGRDDAACPGECGWSRGSFACLCLNKHRERIIAHADADLDIGWTGTNHDAGVVEGASYIVDLYDCDGVVDVDCLIGPHCDLSKTGCSTNGDCPLAGDFCRKERTAVGPHCNLDIRQTCSTNADCPDSPGLDDNHCIHQFHGPPLPLSAGGVSMCVVRIFTEDVTGTRNLETGASAVRLREKWVMHLGVTNAQPCPVCVDLVCSHGPNAGKACRPDPPFGGSTALFGTTSLDCPPFPEGNISGNGLDILFDPVTTGTINVPPSFPCSAAAYATKRCVGGPNEGRPCTVASQCTPGACNDQCFCPPGGGRAGQPNECDAACVGGANDSNSCTTDADCDPPSGFCHPGDCRVNPADPDGATEGQCAVGPVSGSCSISALTACASDADCTPAGGCPFCESGETCVAVNRQCFVNSGIIRTGVPHPTDPWVVAQSCIPATASVTINYVAGFPGPVAIRQRVGVVDIGSIPNQPTPTRTPMRTPVDERQTPVPAPTHRTPTPTPTVTSPLPCSGQTCGNFTGFCSPHLPECFCFKLKEGGGNCVDDFHCGSAQSCAGSSGSCPSGQRCYVDTCCDGPVCGPNTCTGVIVRSIGRDGPTATGR